MEKNTTTKTLNQNRMKRRRINMTKAPLPKWFARLRRRYLKIVKEFYEAPPRYINEEYD